LALCPSPIFRYRPAPDTYPSHKAHNRIHG
jgi:hypothetical protein